MSWGRGHYFHLNNFLLFELLHKCPCITFQEIFKSKLKVLSFEIQHFTYYFFSVGSIPNADPNMGLKLTTVRPWPEPRSRVGCSTSWTTQVPLRFNILKHNFKIHFFSIMTILLKWKAWWVPGKKWLDWKPSL